MLMYSMDIVLSIASRARALRTEAELQLQHNTTRSVSKVSAPERSKHLLVIKKIKRFTEIPPCSQGREIVKLQLAMKTQTR